MKMNFKLLTLVSMLCVGAQLQAYRFTFRNTTNLTVDVKMRLDFINETHEQITIAPKGEASFNPGGWKIGFCMDGNSLQLKKEGGEFKTLPVVHTSREMYDNMINDMKSNGKTQYSLGTAEQRMPGICFDRTFDIVLDAGGELHAIMVHSFF